MRDAKGHKQTTTYNPDWQVATVGDQTGTSSSYATTTYESQAAVNNHESMTGAKSATGARASMTYPAVGTPAAANNGTYRPSSSTATFGAVSTMLYDAAGNGMQVSGPTGTGTAGAVARSAHNSDGTVSAVVSPRNINVLHSGNQRNVCAAGRSDQIGQPGASTALDDCTYYAYGVAVGNPKLITQITVNPPARAVWLKYTTTNYDTAGRVTSSTDGRGTTMSFTYDAQDRVLTETRGPDVITYTYDLAGNQVTQADTLGTTTNSYDELNRLRVVDRPAASGVADLAYTYDRASNLLTSTTAAVGAAAEETITYGYDTLLNLVTSVTEPAAWGARVTSFSYDASQRREVTTYPGGVIQVRRHDAAGTVRRIISGQGTYNLSTETFSGRVDSDLVYCYSTSTGTAAVPACTTSPAAAAGSATADTGKIQWRYDSVAAQRETYTYDGDGRLIQALTTSSTGATVSKYNYTYDAGGNRLTDSDQTTSRRHVYDAGDALCLTDSVAGATAPAVNTSRHVCPTAPTATAPVPGDAALTAYAYDGAGSQTSAARNPSSTSNRYSASYNARNQLTSVDTFGSDTATTATYQGTNNGDRTTRTLPGGAVSTYTNGLLGTQAESSSSGRMSTLRDPSGSLVAVREPSGAMRYVHTDNQNSVIRLTNEAGDLVATYTYDPYGAHHTATGPSTTLNPYRYISGYLDAANMYKLGIRYYDSDLGRFTQPDPTGIEPNSYAYAQGDPCNMSDPSGAASIVGVAKCAAAITAVVAGAYFGALKVAKLVKRVQDFGGVRATVRLITGATTRREKIDNTVKVFGALAASVIGLAAVDDYCLS